MRVKVFYTELKDKILDIDKALIDQVCDGDKKAIHEIECQIGEGCSLCGVWDETDTACLVEI